MHVTATPYETAPLDMRVKRFVRLPLCKCESLPVGQTVPKTFGVKVKHEPFHA